VTEGPKKFTAQMAKTFDGAHWQIYIVVLGQTEWPTIRIREPKGIPTVATRIAVLEELGFRLATELAEWDWIEMGDPDDFTVPVKLLATTTVVPLGNEYLTRSGIPPHA
jgi:hypothetical protein